MQNLHSVHCTPLQNNILTLTFETKAEHIPTFEGQIFWKKASGMRLKICVLDN